MTKDKTNEKSDKKIQELYMQMSTFNQQTNELQKQIQTLEESMMEATESKKGIIEINKSENGKEILVPIVSGIFTKAELKDTNEFIVNVGGNTAVVKSVEGVTSLLDKQLEQMQRAQNTFIDDLQKLTVKAKDVESELKTIMQK